MPKNLVLNIAFHSPQVAATSQLASLQAVAKFENSSLYSNDNVQDALAAIQIAFKTAEKPLAINLVGHGASAAAAIATANAIFKHYGTRIKVNLFITAPQAGCYQADDPTIINIPPNVENFYASFGTKDNSKGLSPYQFLSQATQVTAVLLPGSSKDQEQGGTNAAKLNQYFIEQFLVKHYAKIRTEKINLVNSGKEATIEKSVELVAKPLSNTAIQDATSKDLVVSERRLLYGSNVENSINSTEPGKNGNLLHNTMESCFIIGGAYRRRDFNIPQELQALSQELENFSKLVDKLSHNLPSRIKPFLELRHQAYMMLGELAREYNQLKSANRDTGAIIALATETEKLLTAFYSENSTKNSTKVITKKIPTDFNQMAYQRTYQRALEKEQLNQQRSAKLERCIANFAQHANISGLGAKLRSLVGNILGLGSALVYGFNLLMQRQSPKTIVKGITFGFNSTAQAIAGNTVARKLASAAKEAQLLPLEEAFTTPPRGYA